MADAARVAIRTAKAMEAGQLALASNSQKLDVLLEKVMELEGQVILLQDQVETLAEAIAPGTAPPSQAKKPRAAAPKGT